MLRLSPQPEALPPEAVLRLSPQPEPEVVPLETWSQLCSPPPPGFDQPQPSSPLLLDCSPAQVPPQPEPEPEALRVSPQPAAAPPAAKEAAANEAEAVLRLPPQPEALPPEAEAVLRLSPQPEALPPEAEAVLRLPPQPEPEPEALRVSPAQVPTQREPEPRGEAAEKMRQLPDAYLLPNFPCASCAGWPSPGQLPPVAVRYRRVFQDCEAEQTLPKRSAPRLASPEASRNGTRQGIQF